MDQARAGYGKRPAVGSIRKMLEFESVSSKTSRSPPTEIHEFQGFIRLLAQCRTSSSAPAPRRFQVKLHRQRNPSLEEKKYSLPEPRSH